MGLYNRREDWVEVPEGVSLLTIGADCQDNRVEWEVVGWGDGEESWSIDYQVRFGDLTKADFWKMIARDMKRTYARKDGYIFNPMIACIDSGGHFTDEVYEFSRVHGSTFFIPVKGSSLKGKPIADYPRKMNKKRVRLTMVGTDTAKDVIYSRLELQDKGPGYSHFPQERNTDYFQQLTAEKKIMRYVKGFPVYDYVLTSGTRNEALDCRVYAFAGVRILQQYFGQQLDIPDKIVKNTDNVKKSDNVDRFQRHTGGGFNRR
jgi:phage terminase large subunit GpA-like protein